MSFTRACSLKAVANQIIQPNTWTIVHFEGVIAESSDDYGMHNSDALGDQSGLIVAGGGSGWGLLAGMAQWSFPSDATETRLGFVRDPFATFGDSSDDYDTTATNHYARTPGGDYVSLTWPMWFLEGRPHALRVRHDASTEIALAVAEFKLLF